MEAALSVTQALAAGSNGLCCGAFGQIDFLLTAGLRLGREDLVQKAGGLAIEALQRARKGILRSTHEQPPELTPGFFQGTTGIAYELLRVAFPHRLPSVLLWEAGS